MRKVTIGIIALVLFVGGVGGIAGSDLTLVDFRLAEQNTQWDNAANGESYGMHVGDSRVFVSNETGLRIYNKETGEVIQSMEAPGYQIMGVHNDVIYGEGGDAYGIDKNVSINSSYTTLDIEEQNGDTYLLFGTENDNVGKENLDTGEKTTFTNTTFSGLSSWANLQLVDSGNIVAYKFGNINEVSENGVVWSDSFPFSSEGRVRMNDELFISSNYSSPKTAYVYSVEDMVENQEVSKDSRTYFGEVLASWYYHVALHEDNFIINSYDDAFVFNKTGSPKARWDSTGGWVGYEDYGTTNGNFTVYDTDTDTNGNWRVKKIQTDVPVSGQVDYNPGEPENGEGIDYNPDNERENISANQLQEIFYSEDGGASNPEEWNSEMVTEVDKNNGILYWNVYTESASGSSESWKTNYIYNPDSDKSNGNIEPREGRRLTLNQPIINPEPAYAVFPNTSIEPWQDSKQFAFQSSVNGDNLISPSGDTVLYSAAKTSGQTQNVIHNDPTGEIVGFDTIEFSGENAIIYGADSPLQTYIYYPESGEKESLVSSGMNTERFDSFVSNKSTIISYHNYYAMGATEEPTWIQAINTDTGRTSYFQQRLLGKNSQYVVIDSNDGLDVFNRKEFGEIASSLPYQNNISSKYAVGEIPHPNNISEFDRGFYEGKHWFFVNNAHSKMYVYDKELSDIEATINNAWSETDGPQRSFEPYVHNNTVRYTTTDDNIIEFYDTGIEVPEETVANGCNAYLQPNQLQNMSESDNVCWIPIYTGIDTLGTVYQWLILALMIAMPIAKETKSDIATMATIDGVILIGMLVGGVSAGFAAISLLSTILLVTYNKRGADVTVNNIGNGEL